MAFAKQNSLTLIRCGNYRYLHSTHILFFRTTFHLRNMRVIFSFFHTVKILSHNFLLKFRESNASTKELISRNIFQVTVNYCNFCSFCSSHMYIVWKNEKFSLTKKKKISVKLTKLATLAATFLFMGNMSP